MYKRKLTLGVATAAALLLPLGFVSPALAEEPVEAPAVEAPVTEAPVEVPDEGDAPVSADTADETQAPAAESDEQGSIDVTPEVIDPAAPIDPSDAPLITEEELEAEDAPSDIEDLELNGETLAVKPTFGNVRLSSPGSMSPPNGSTNKVKNLTLYFDGPAPTTNINYYGYDAAYYGPTVAISTKNSGVRSDNVIRPYAQFTNSKVTPAAGNRVQISTSRYVTPGKYKVTVPVTQRVYTSAGYKNSTKSIYKYLTVKSNTNTSKKMSGISGSARAGQKFPVSITAPDYHAGAKVTVYYRAAGAKSYVAVNTGRLKANGYNSKTTVNISKSYNVAGRGGRIYVKVNGVEFADSYKTASAAITRY